MSFSKSLFSPWSLGGEKGKWVLDLFLSFLFFKQTIYNNTMKISIGFYIQKNLLCIFMAVFPESRGLPMGWEDRRSLKSRVEG